MLYIVYYRIGADSKAQSFIDHGLYYLKRYHTDNLAIDIKAGRRSFGFMVFVLNTNGFITPGVLRLRR